MRPKRPVGGKEEALAVQSRKPEESLTTNEIGSSDFKMRQLDS